MNIKREADSATKKSVLIKKPTNPPAYSQPQSKIKFEPQKEKEPSYFHLLPDSTKRKIIDTKHFIERFLERYPNFPREKVNKVIFDGMDKIYEDYNDETGIYIIHSKSTKIGVVVNWRREGDPRRDDGNNHAVILTIPRPANSHWAMNPEEEVVIIVEKLALEYFKEKKVRLSECSHEGELVFAKFGKDNDFIITFFEGKLYDFNAIPVYVR